MRDVSSLMQQSLPKGLNPVGVFGRFAVDSGQTVDVCLESETLGKSVPPCPGGQGLSEMFAAIDDLCGKRRGRPLAYVGVGFGPTFRDWSALGWSKDDFVDSEHPRWPKDTPQGSEFRPKDDAQSYEVQREEGLRIMRDLGIIR